MSPTTAAGSLLERLVGGTRSRRGRRSLERNGVGLRARGCADEQTDVVAGHDEAGGFSRESLAGTYAEQ